MINFCLHVQILYSIILFVSKIKVNGRLAQLVRASALQAEGHRFEPYCAHHFYIFFIYGPVVQLVRTLACHARGRGFEPHLPPEKAFFGRLFL